MPLELNGIHYVKIASKTDSRAAAAWAATAILAWTKAQQIAPEFASEADLSFQQVEIAELANRLCNNLVQAAPINKNYVAGKGNHNFLVHVAPNRRRLPLYQEFEEIDEYPTWHVNYGWQVLTDGNGNYLTYNSLIKNWWKEKYTNYFTEDFIDTIIVGDPPKPEPEPEDEDEDEPGVVVLWYQYMPNNIRIREGNQNGQIVGTIDTRGGRYHGSLRVFPRLMELLLNAGARQPHDFIINDQYINFPEAVDEEAAFEFLENYFKVKGI
jgi:hypothetical protein